MWAIMWTVLMQWIRNKLNDLSDRIASFGHLQPSSLVQNQGTGSTHHNCYGGEEWKQSLEVPHRKCRAFPKASTANSQKRCTTSCEIDNNGHSNFRPAAGGCSCQSLQKCSCSHHCMAPTRICYRCRSFGRYPRFCRKSGNVNKPHVRSTSKVNNSSEEETKFICKQMPYYKLNNDDLQKNFARNSCWVFQIEKERSELENRIEDYEKLSALASLEKTLIEYKNLECQKVQNEREEIMKSLKSSNHQLEIENASVNQEMSKIKSELVCAKIEIERVNGENQKHKSDLCDANKGIRNLNERNMKLDSELASAKEENANHSNNLNLLYRIIQELYQINLNLNIEVGEVRNDVMTYITDYDRNANVCYKCGTENCALGPYPCKAKGHHCKSCNRRNHFTAMCQSRSYASMAMINPRFVNKYIEEAYMLGYDSDIMYLLWQLQEQTGIENLLQ